MKKILPILTIAIAAFIAGVFSHTYFQKTPTSDIEAETGNYELRAGGYGYINPLLECEVADGSSLFTLRNLRLEIEDHISATKKSGTISEASVYIRDLNNGPWMGINERVEFSPASLLKVPVMIAFYKLAEEDPSLLDVKIKYNGEFENIDNLGDPAKSIASGQTYTIEELIRKMIIHSDNKAKSLLKEYLRNKIPGDRVKKTAEEIGLILPVSDESDAHVTVKSYASVFRILFNASYLNKTMSEKALALLAEADYDAGLSAGLPKGVQLANKYGFRESVGQYSQLHDCGIAYFPGKPLLVCVMTRFQGEDLAKPGMAIAGVARIVSDYYSNR